jgi:hypothetical protein
MGIFNIKLIPIEKARDWEYKYLSSSRIKKTCVVCKKEIPKTSQNTSFMKRTSRGSHTDYETYYTCGHSLSPCTIEMKERLNIKL